MSKKKTKKKSKNTKKATSDGSLNKYRCVRDPEGKYKTNNGVRVSIEKASDGATIHSRLPYGNAKNKSNFVTNKKLKDVKSQKS